MSKIQITGPSTGTGTLTLTSTATNTDQTITFPNTTATVVAVDPGTASNVLTSNGSAWVSQAAAAGGGDYIMQVFTTPGTWTKAAGLKAIKVTVIGGGGGGGGSAGGTSSFGAPAFLSATGGGGSSQAGGSGSGGTINASGGRGAGGLPFTCSAIWTAVGGASAFGFGVSIASVGPAVTVVPGANYGGGSNIGSNGGGGGGGAIEYIDAPALPGPQPYTVGAGGPAPTGATGGAGVIIVEEFY
jgi:hypothetical protein